MQSNGPWLTIRQRAAREASLTSVHAHVAMLTPREREVFELVIRGRTNKQVANVLGATERTIKAHRHKVMEKMQVQSLAELVSLAERAGILRDLSGYRTGELNNSHQEMVRIVPWDNRKSGIAALTKVSGELMKPRPDRLRRTLTSFGSSLGKTVNGAMDRPGITNLPNRNVVFVVDDDLGMLKGLKRLLRQHGYDSVRVFVRRRVPELRRFRFGMLRGSRHQPEQ